MKIDYDDDGRTATLEIEEYGDLLACRALSEWHFIGDTTVATTVEHLNAAGITEGKPGEIEWLTPAEMLMDFQEWIVQLALDRERFAIFSLTGSGKSFMQLEYARQVTEYHGGRTLIVAPLLVCPQTANDEREKFYGDSLKIEDLRDRKDLNRWLEIGSGIGITNYEKIDGTESTLPVDAVVLDEASVLKQSMGARRTSLIKAFKGLRWKLCCSATPAPNDRVEYAEQAYFLDVVRSTREFLAAYFVNRDGEWQLKGHGENAFYRHLASWSVFLRSPDAYGFKDGTDALPELHTTYPYVDLTTEQMERAREFERSTQSSLFGATPGGIVSRTKVQQVAHGFLLKDGKVVDQFPSFKPGVIAYLCNVKHAKESVIVWTTFDHEGDQLVALIPDAVALSGKTNQAKRDAIITGFRRGDGPRVLVCKSAMLGHGMNFQACHVQVFSSMGDSFERFFQAVRRSYRYGQTEPVYIYIPKTDLDDAMIQNVMNKEAVWEYDAARQEQAYIDVLRPSDTTERRVLVTEPQAEIDRVESDHWTMIQADCIAHMPTMDADSVDFSVFSLPFANLFTYSSALADMGNVKSDTEYKLQWKFFAERLFRVMKPGRNCALHIMDIIRFAGASGTRHTYDFPSDVRDGMEAAGFLYRSRISIDKNPQLQATRTKDHNLLFVTLTRDALNSHSQAGEYVLVFTKPGENGVPVVASDISNQEWITWAHHIWYDIRETDVLNAALGKDSQDERHICPLQLGLIERCVRLWSNPGETVFDPFAGIGSSGVEALSWGREFRGIELKTSYFSTACNFLREKEIELSGRLFEPSSRMYVDAESVVS